MTSTDLATPPSLTLEEGYIPLHHGPCHQAFRRTILPGLFEVIRNTTPDKYDSYHHYLQALQPKDECEKFLLQERVRIEVRGANGWEVEYNTNALPAVGDGEDRRAMNALTYTGVQQGFREWVEGDRTFWECWKDLVKREKAAKDGHACPDENYPIPREEPEAVEQTDEITDPVDTVEHSEEKNLLLFSIFDGHGGSHIADLLKTAVHSFICYALPNNEAAMSGDEDAMVEVIKNVYTAISQDISYAPLSLLKSPRYLGLETAYPGLPSIAHLFMSEFERGGACMATAIMDLRREKLYVAHLGDVRVVATTRKADGTRCVRTMTKDHNGYNEAEVTRHRAAHPNDPNAIVYQPGGFYRVLGNLPVTQAVGDPHSNWPEQERQELLALDVFDKVHPLEHPTIEPPYIGWTPTVSVCPLVSEEGEKVETVIIASDGLWDKMTSAEAALATVAHSATGGARQEAQTSQELLSDHRLDFSGIPDGVDKQVPPDRKWFFQDRLNPATHLIRNAMSHGDEEELQQMLSLKHGTRLFRDDTTVMVVHLERPTAEKR